MHRSHKRQYRNSAIYEELYQLLVWEGDLLRQFRQRQEHDLGWSLFHTLWLEQLLVCFQFLRNIQLQPDDLRECDLMMFDVIERIQRTNTLIAQLQIEIFPDGLCSRSARITNITQLTKEFLVFLTRFAGTTALEEIEIYDTTISTVPDIIGLLTQLKRLILRNNQLRNLPAAVGSLTNLQLLDVSDNCIDALPGNLIRLTQLSKVNISGNPIESAFFGKYGPTYQLLLDLERIVKCEIQCSSTLAELADDEASDSDEEDEKYLDTCHLSSDEEDSASEWSEEYVVAFPKFLAECRDSASEEMAPAPDIMEEEERVRKNIGVSSH